MTRNISSWQSSRIISVLSGASVSFTLVGAPPQIVPVTANLDGVLPIGPSGVALTIQYGNLVVEPINPVVVPGGAAVTYNRSDAANTVTVQLAADGTTLTITASTGNGIQAVSGVAV